MVQDPRKTWLATGSLLTVWKRLPFLGPSLLLAFWLWLLPTCLPASGRGGGPVCSQLAKNPRDRGAWWASIYGVAESDTTEVT